MSEIPSWWLVLSGIFFFMNTLLFIAGIVAAIYVIKLTQDLAPKIASLETSVRELIVKVQAVTDRVEEVAASVRDTVDSVGGKAKHVVGSAELVAVSATRQFERMAPIVSGILTTLKVLRAVQSYRAAKSASKEKASKNGKSLAVHKR